MKRLLAIFVVCAMLMTACGQSSGSVNLSDTVVGSSQETEVQTNEINASNVTEDDSSSIVAETDDGIADDTPEFNNLNDPDLLQYMEDSIYAELTGLFASEDYVIENVSAIYYSKEYLEESAYNSKANVFFGYTLEELDEQFQGNRYVFTLSEDGETIVEPFEDYDDTYDQVIQNITVGTGVILICVTVSVVTGGLSTPVSAIFAASAKTGTVMALSSGVFSGVVAGVVNGFQTDDMEETVKSAALAGSEGFKWGAIGGSLVGGVSEANVLRNASKAAEVASATTTSSNGIPSWRESETAVLEKYGGRKQVSYFEGEEVAYGTPGATRPDVVRTVNGHIEAIEVKNYDLSTASSQSELYSVLEREITDRVANLPEGSTQRIVLDVTGRGFSAELVDSVTEKITERLAGVYSNIPIDIIGL